MAPYHVIPHTTVSILNEFSPIPTSPFAHKVGLHSYSERQNQLDTDGPYWDVLDPDEESDWLSLGYIKHYYNDSTYWCPPKYDYSSTAMTLPIFNAADYSRAPDSDLLTMAQWSKSHLLSLPKELRLEIWKYVLTDPSVPDVTVEITREPLSPSKSSLRFPIPCLMTTLQPPRNCPIGLEILRANKFVFTEALPVLYHSVKFAPLDLGSIFPIFLDPIRPFARSHIRHIKLRVPVSIYDIDLFGDPSATRFQWAVTCAQVAKVEAVQDVEVEGFCVGGGSKRLQRSLLYPLCKIKAKKTFGPKNDEAAQQALAVFEEEWKAQAPLRRERTMSEAAERAERDERDELRSQEAQRSERARRHTSPLFTTADSTIDRDIAQIPGIRQFEEELLEHASSADNSELPEYDTLDFGIGEWDVVSLASGAFTPTLQLRSPSVLSADSADVWTDTASTVLNDEGTTKNQGLDSEMDHQTQKHRRSSRSSGC